MLIKNNINSSWLCRNQNILYFLNLFFQKPGVEIHKDHCESLSNFQDYLDYVKNKFVSIEKNRKARRCRKKKLKNYFSKQDHVKLCTNKRSFEEISKVS